MNHVFYVVAAMFCKPIQDHRISPAMVSKGSIYAAVQHDAASRVMNGNSSTPGDITSGHLSSRHDTVPLNHRATPNSDEASDPDAASNTSFDTSVRMQVVRVTTEFLCFFNNNNNRLLGSCSRHQNFNKRNQLLMII